MSNIKKIFEVVYEIERSELMGGGGSSMPQRAAIVVDGQPITPDLYLKIYDFLSLQAPKGKLIINSINHYMAGTVYLLEDNKEK